LAVFFFLGRALWRKCGRGDGEVKKGEMLIEAYKEEDALVV
jgi:hypothetical protein